MYARRGTPLRLPPRAHLQPGRGYGGLDARTLDGPVTDDEILREGPLSRLRVFSLRVPSTTDGQTCA
jgi:hypothetical protein